MRQITLKDFLTSEQIDAAFRIYRDHPEHEVAKRICEEVIRPNLTAINRKLGQENDPMFLAYACVYVFGQSRNRP